VLTTCMSLLEDDSSAVKLATASLLSELAGHSSGAKSRLAVGKTTGFSQTPEKVGFGSCCFCLGGWWVGGGWGVGDGGWGMGVGVYGLAALLVCWDKADHVVGDLGTPKIYCSMVVPLAAARLVQQDRTQHLTSPGHC
jgi:hypothetical protein